MLNHGEIMQQVHRKMEIGMFCNEYNLRTNDMTQNTMLGLELSHKGYE